MKLVIFVITFTLVGAVCSAASEYEKQYSYEDSRKVLAKAVVFKYLGLILDPLLKWDQHVSYVSGKLRPILGVLHKARSILPRHIREIV